MFIIFSIRGGFIISKPTIKSIAKDLDLSSSTVSKALSGQPEINSDTRIRILNHANEVGYMKNPNGRRRFGILVVKTSTANSINPLMLDLIMSFRDYAGKLGYDVIMLSADKSSQEEETFDHYISANQLDGVFISGLETTDTYYVQLKDTVVPVVLMDMFADSPLAGSVGTDSILGGELAVSHLVKNGHRRIGFVNGHKEAYISKERLAGYITGIQNHDIDYDPHLYYVGDFSSESGARAADYFAKTDATAVYFASDLMAHGAVKRFLEIGYTLPVDMSIVGFDNMPIGQGCIPSITTIAQNPVSLGENACALLCGIIQKSPIRRVSLGPYLIERESVAKREG